MQLTYPNSANLVTLEDCLWAYDHGIAVIIDEGKHVTFEIED